MGVNCSKGKAERIVKDLTNTIIEEREAVIRNFKDMDFYNVDAYVRTYEIVNEIVKDFDNMISELNNYYFL